MTWKGFFEGIQSFFESVAFAPYNAFRRLEPESWWGANTVTWIFILIAFSAFIYWMLQLKEHTAAGEEDRSLTAHIYLGKKTNQ